MNDFPQIFMDQLSKAVERLSHFLHISEVWRTKVLEKYNRELLSFERQLGKWSTPSIRA